MNAATSRRLRPTTMFAGMIAPGEAAVADRVERVLVTDLALVEVRAVDALAVGDLRRRALGAGDVHRVAAGAALGEELARRSGPTRTRRSGRRRSPSRRPRAGRRRRATSSDEQEETAQRHDGGGSYETPSRRGRPLAGAPTPAAARRRPARPAQAGHARGPYVSARRRPVAAVSERSRGCHQDATVVRRRRAAATGFRRPRRASFRRDGARAVASGGRDGGRSAAVPRGHGPLRHRRRRRRLRRAGRARRA